MYRQGALDSLCGVYAVINSTKAMADRRGVRISRTRCRDLFIELCVVLADGGRLADAITQGTGIRTFQQMVRAAHEWTAENYGLRLKSVRAFNTQPAGLADYWTRVQAHAETFEAGSVLLGMVGRYDHWSCIRSISERRISLVDSDGIQHLNRDRCTVAAPSGRRQLILCPTQTLLVSD
ncbi:hypothetical protein [Caulobacter sp. BE254]|uniref:hypothetical protein n=1 Tax=Caulobacter sp. BE254 TaxID=2817720 RepID=UPI00285905B2|nr:hypothetical protein [Caulobacter sp. BE254]MDR7117397.1 hypothetical protein [Caulobacter sp. BE254]